MISQNKKIITFAGLYIAFITIGLISNMAGPLVPYLKGILKLSSTDTGFLISANFTGMIISVIFGGIIADKIGKKRFLISAATIVFCAMILAVFSESYIFLLSALLINGIGFGMFEVGINSYAVDFCRENKLSPEKNMNIIHFFFGVGAIISPLIIKFSLKEMGYTTIFKLIMIFSFMTVFFLFFSADTISGQNKKSLSDTVKFLISQKLLWISGIIIFLYVGIEVTTSGWLPEFWSRSATDRYISAPLTASIFWGALTFGRLISAFVAEKLGNKRYLLSSAFLLFIFTFLWNFITLDLFHIIIIVITGLLLSGLFPAIINLSQKNNEGNSAVITSFVLIFASIGGSVIPVFAGGMVDVFTIKAVPVVVSLTSFLFLLIIIYYNRYSANQEKHVS